VRKVGPLGRPAREGKKRRRRPAGLEMVAGQKNRRMGEREREGEEKRVFLLNFLSNSFFKHSNSNQTKSMHSNHDAQTLIISKSF
jgi:hypothetical protein